jgi:hypothetical protein
MFISVTRLRIKSWWYLPQFFWINHQAMRQAKNSTGFRGGFALVDRHRAFWTLTKWDSAAAMKAYRGAGAHLAAMKKLPVWCDEASVAHWEGDSLPSWTEAWQRMQSAGRFTPVNTPSQAQREKRVAEPRTQPLMQRAI